MRPFASNVSDEAALAVVFTVHPQAGQFSDGRACAIGTDEQARGKRFTAHLQLQRSRAIGEAVKRSLSQRDALRVQLLLQHVDQQRILDDMPQIGLGKIRGIEPQRRGTARGFSCVPDMHTLVGKGARRKHPIPDTDGTENPFAAARQREHTQVRSPCGRPEARRRFFEHTQALRR